MGREKVPQLEGPQLQPALRGLGANVATGLVAMALVTSFAVALSFGSFDGRSGVHASDTLDHTARLLSHDMAPGAIRLVPEGLVADHMFEKMPLSLSEKARLKTEIADARTRLGKLTVWDNVAEDQDRIRLSSSGYDQDIRISHARQTFYLPVVTGAIVGITATADGGGGVTLGVDTLVGPVLLPPLDVGQTVEIPVL